MMVRSAHLAGWLVSMYIHCDRMSPFKQIVYALVAGTPCVMNILPPYSPFLLSIFHGLHCTCCLSLYVSTKKALNT